MPDLFLVGETIDAATAHRLARADELIQIIRGVYLAAAADADEVLATHAVRIAHFLYPTAYLSSASAIRLGPSPDGRLFLSGRRNQRTRLRLLDIVQVRAPPRPSLDRALVGDSLGELSIMVSSPEQRMLEAFRARSEQAGAIDETMRRDTADRLIAEYGSAEAAADVLWKLARINDWIGEGAAAERYLRGTARPPVAAANRAALSLLVAWHGRVMGALAHDGHEWHWSPARHRTPPLIRETVPGTLPPFIESLLPEGWLAQVLRNEDERSALRSGRRYMSNITIAADKAELASLPVDRLQGRLADHSREGVFRGRYEGPDRGTLDTSFEANLARIFEAKTTPRLSGVQIKAPMNLDMDGRLRAAVDLPFTHILKPAGTAGFEQMPIVEWTCLELGRLAGFVVPATALVRMPDAMPPALLVERFDIREDENDHRCLALEDFCSVLGVPAEDKYKGTIERMAKALRGLSTDPDEDLERLYERALFAWLIADGDMHLKNVALLKVAKPEARRFETVRMTPLYDTLTTRVFPGLRHDRMALRLAGKDDRLKPADFALLARTIGLPARRGSSIVKTMSATLAKAAGTLRPPALARQSKGATDVVEEVKALVFARCAAFLNEA